MKKQMNYFYDENKTRYTLVSTKGGKPLNWLFIPGGPGCDSDYLLSLIELLNLPGNIWLIDFPGNGSNKTANNDPERWLSLFVPMLKKFQNPVVVGHSFGGMLPLLFKECEELLKGMVILNSSPSLWLEEAAKAAAKYELSDLSALHEFSANPNQETFNEALKACVPYYFPAHSLKRGTDLIEKMTFSFEPAVWWQHKAIEIEYKAVWVPENVKTLIIGGEFDAMVPFALFEKDERFNRPNIKKFLIKDAGHAPWIEKPQEIANHFQEFEAQL